jgi:hypothetical protein
VQLSADEAYFESVVTIDPMRAIAFGWVPFQTTGMWLRTSDGGQSWTNVSPAGGGALIEDATFVDPNTGWAAGGLLYKSTDAGQSWAVQHYPGFFLNGISFADAQNGWAVGESSLVLHTADGGAHWATQDTRSPAGVLIAVHAVSPTTAWIVGGSGYVARTSDGGVSWQVETPGTPGTDYYDAAYFLDADHGWVGGTGIWKRDGPGGCASPSPYCVAKPNSSGGLASLAWSGTPSVSSGPFAVRVSGALPNRLGLFFTSATGSASTPFANGTLCVRPPLTRVPALHLDASGAASQPVIVTPGMVGATRWYQFMYRDAQNLDGTGLGLSNGLAVTFCN